MYVCMALPMGTDGRRVCICLIVIVAVTQQYWFIWTLEDDDNNKD